MSRRGLIVAGVLTAALGLIGAVAAFGAPGKQAATTVSVTAGKPTEFKYTLSKKTVAKGAVTFKVANKGEVEHDFKVAGKKTPRIATDKSSTLKVTFKKAGKFPYLCTVPGHAAAGMKGTLTVK